MRGPARRKEAEGGRGKGGGREEAGRKGGSHPGPHDFHYCCKKPTHLTAALASTSMLGIPRPVAASHPGAVWYPSGQRLPLGWKRKLFPTCHQAFKKHKSIDYWQR